MAISFKEAERKAIEGPGVIYRGHIYAVLEVDKFTKTCKLVRLPDGFCLLHVPLDELYDEQDYEWSENGDD